MKFWQELRRRRVFRLAGLYVVGAWLVIQVADISFPAWGVPETALRYLFIAAAACFPVALIFSWYYDITSKGIVRTEPAASSEEFDLRLKRADYALLAALLAVGFAILLGSADRIQDEIDYAVERRAHSIAVLPFVNLDADPDTGYFSDGITEEILHKLSTLRALHVLASTSSFVFRDSEESPARISETLGVGYLLQGSIRRDDEHVRVTARLIDESGFQVWSESFDRKLESIFAIQTEIASTVSSQIINEIVPIQELPAGRTTTNMEAYNEYLIGKAHLDARTAGWREKARAAFTKAIELDEGFAPPYAGLATAISVMTGFGPQWDEARELAEKALELDPELAEAHAILGLTLRASRNPRQAEASLRRALELDPSLGFAYNILHIVLGDQGLGDEADAVLNKALDVDPLSPPIVLNVAETESRNGNLGRAEQLVLRLMSLPQPPPLAFVFLSDLYDDWGRLADAVASAKDAIRVELAHGEPASFDQLAYTYASLGMTEEAGFWIDLSLSSSPDDPQVDLFVYWVAHRLDKDSEPGAMLWRLLDTAIDVSSDPAPFMLFYFGLTDIQLERYAQGIEQMEAGLGSNQDIDIAAIAAAWDPALFTYVFDRLAFAYQRVGRSDDANRLLQAMSIELGISLESIPKYPNGREDVALHLALLGDTPGALSALRQAADIGWSNYNDVVNDPAWAETLRAPEFQEILAEVKTAIDHQRSIVEAADAEHDFRAEVEQLLPNK